MIQSLIIHIIRGLVRVINRIDTPPLGKQEKTLISSKLVGHSENKTLMNTDNLTQ